MLVFVWSLSRGPGGQAMPRALTPEEVPAWTKKWVTKQLYPPGVCDQPLSDPNFQMLASFWVGKGKPKRKPPYKRGPILTCGAPLLATVVGGHDAWMPGHQAKFGLPHFWRVFLTAILGLESRNRCSKPPAGKRRQPSAASFLATQIATHGVASKL